MIKYDGHDENPNPEMNHSIRSLASICSGYEKILVSSTSHGWNRPKVYDSWTSSFAAEYEKYLSSN